MHQERPTAEEWKLWTKANRLWSTSTGTLFNPLGQWLYPRPLQRQQHFAYLHRGRRLYLRVGDDQYQVCLPTGTPGEYRFYPRFRTFKTVKSAAHPVHVTVSHTDPDCWNVDSEMYGILPSVSTTCAETFEAFINTLEPWEIDVLRMTTMHADPNATCEALSYGLRAASDGSVRFLTQGSFGWTLSTDHGIQAATGMGPARGPRPSNRIELKVMDYSPFFDFSFAFQSIPE